ncbi:hypothetical protein BKA93DRAFT_33452 [Sparassis latifolia]
MCCYIVLSSSSSVHCFHHKLTNLRRLEICSRVQYCCSSVCIPLNEWSALEFYPLLVCSTLVVAAILLALLRRSYILFGSGIGVQRILLFVLVLRRLLWLIIIIVLKSTALAGQESG